MQRRLLLFLLLIWPATAVAQPSWGSLRLPGTPELMARAGGWPEEGLERTRLAYDLVKKAHSRGTLPAEIASLRTYVRTLRDIRRSLEATSASAISDVARALGYDFVSRGDVIGVAARRGEDDILRQRVVNDLGITPEAIATALTTAPPKRIVLPSFEVPLPLGMLYWQDKIVDERLDEESLFDFMLENRQAGLYYIGLMGLDPETAAWFATEDALRDAALENVVVFASFSASVRVRSGRVIAPLGLEATPAWEMLAEASLDRPRRFVENLLRKDRGRLAWFYDSVARYPDDHQRFALSTWKPPPEQLDDVWATYQWFRTFEDPIFLVHPFYRPPFDPELALLIVQTSPTGTLAPPNARNFVRETFDSVKTDSLPRETFEVSEPRNLIGPSDLLRILFDSTPETARARAHAFAYAQRVAARLPEITSPQLAILLRGRFRFPGLLQALERVEDLNAETLVLAVRHAELLTRTDRTNSAGISLLQFQSSLALLRAMAASGALSSAAVNRLVAGLSQLPVSDRGEYRGAVVRWWRDDVLAGLPQSPVRDMGPEDRVLAAIADTGLRTPAPEFVWAGFQYRADTGPSRLRDLEVIRAEQSAPAFDSVIDFIRAVDALAQVTSVAEARPWIDWMATTGERLIDYIPGGDVQRAANVDHAAEFRRRLAEMSRARTIQDLRRPALLTSLSVMSDWVTAYALLSLTYAAALQDPDDPILAIGDISRRHDIGAFRTERREREDVAWTQPTELINVVVRRSCGPERWWEPCKVAKTPGPDVPWHIEGSVLNLDLAFSPARRLQGGSPSSDPILEEDNQALFASARLAQPSWAGVDQVTRDLTNKIQATRDSLLPRARELSVQPGWRFAALPWAAESEPTALQQLLPLTEVLKIGPDESVNPVPRAFGSEMGALSGCPCRDFLRIANFDSLSDRVGSGYLGVTTANLRLRLAEVLTEYSLPIALLDLVYALVLRDINASAVSGNLRDWLTLIETFQSVTSEELARYVGELTNVGALQVIGVVQP